MIWAPILSFSRSRRTFRAEGDVRLKGFDAAIAILSTSSLFNPIHVSLQGVLMLVMLAPQEQELQY